MHVIVAEVIARAPEISATAGPDRRANEKQQGRRQMPDWKMPLRHDRCRKTLATPTTPARRSALFRPAAVPSIALALDPYDRKDQDGPQSVEGRANHG